ncbi:MAG TPA: DUF4266 domain-containing protein [bacterium]|jgi:hypothetical protein
MKLGTRFTSFVLMLIALSCVIGCATVRPYEREFLADRIMSFEANREEVVMERHFIETREGSMGGYGGAGGGCACN